MALRADDVDLGRDRDLVDRYQNGDPEAFDDLYRRYFDRLRRFCLRHTSDAHEAEELAQEAFVKALGSMDRLQGERRFYPWMTVIARRLVIDRHRKLGRVELTEDPDSGSVDPDIDHLFAEVDAAHVRAALDNLGPRHREVLLLREARSMSYADIAADLDVPVTTVEALLHRARKALRREFVAVGGDTRGLWGLPVLGWIGARLQGLRSRLDERWVEIGAVAAPVAIGAATAAFVLAPAGPDATTLPVETMAPPAASVETGTEAEPQMTTAAPLVIPAAPAPTLEAPSTSTSQPSPSIDAGPVDVYIGPEGTDAAAGKARRMPTSVDVGENVAGVDLEKGGRDVVGFVTDTAGAVLGRPDTGLQTLLGGTP